MYLETNHFSVPESRVNQRC